MTTKRKEIPVSVELYGTRSRLVYASRNNHIGVTEESVLFVLFSRKFSFSHLHDGSLN